MSRYKAAGLCCYLSYEQLRLAAFSSSSGNTLPLFLLSVSCCTFNLRLKLRMQDFWTRTGYSSQQLHISSVKPQWNNGISNREWCHTASVCVVMWTESVTEHWSQLIGTAQSVKQTQNGSHVVTMSLVLRTNSPLKYVPENTGGKCSSIFDQ